MKQCAWGMAVGLVYLLSGLAFAGDPVVATVTNVPPSGMVLIPAGINSGTDPDIGLYSLTNPTAFYMDATEVTKAKWDEVYAWGATHGYRGLRTGGGKATNHPVQSVNWYDVVKWCNVRSEKEGKTPCYNLNDWSCNFAANGYRLPTNTEWEYAARGGLSGKRFPWGDIIDHTRANYYGTASGFNFDQGYAGYDKRYITEASPHTSPVGSFEANGYGLYDMVGNVWEWCNDVTPSGQSRSLRGGAWANLAPLTLWRRHIWDRATDNCYLNGFRAVCR